MILVSGNYVINVSGVDVPQIPQTFVIVYEFINDSLTLTYPQGGGVISNGYAERIRWDAYGNNLGTFTLQYSSDAGASWNLLSGNIPGDRRYYDWAPHTNLNTGQMKMRISKRAFSDMNDTYFQLFRCTPLDCGLIQLAELLFIYFGMRHPMQTGIRFTNWVQNIWKKLGHPPPLIFL